MTSKVGKGTTFIVTLRAADRPTAVQAGLAAAPEVLPKAGTRILIVDDEPAIVEFLSCIMEQTCVVRTASGGDQAIEIIRKEGDFDAIVSDLMMRDGTGIKLYETLKAERPGLEKRIVFMTGGAPTPEAQKFLEMMPNPQIAKPFDVSELQGLIGVIVQEHPAAPAPPH